ncbi:hypothetical protein DFS34DRAFT_580593 [Phlyctochytrium arcticum]|nr:hypothetical protein DFS34DRAFT_580593 [Phlyctochytrium arcticum]
MATAAGPSGAETLISTTLQNFRPLPTVSNECPRLTILLIRHAEKLPWPQGINPSKNIKAAYVDNHLLSSKGYERAHALVGYFQHRQEIQDILKKRPLKAIIAQCPDIEGGWGLSERPRETVQPSHSSLADALPDIPLKQYTKSEVMSLLHSLLSPASINPYMNGTVLISWAHQLIPDMVRALGVPSDQVPEWKKKRFDVTWAVEIENGSATLKQMPQRLLYGDKDEALPLGGDSD